MVASSEKCPLIFRNLRIANCELRTVPSHRANTEKPPLIARQQIILYLSPSLHPHHMANDVCKEEVYRDLFLRLVEPLRHYLYYHCGNAPQAEDLAQEAFLRLWEHCQKVPPEKAKAFVYRVGYNLFLDGIKHRKVVLKFQKQQTEDKAVTSPEFEYETKEFEARLWATVATMPEKSRVVFLMNRIDGCTYKEIAELLEISVKAVEKRMKGALEGLKGLIRDS